MMLISSLCGSIYILLIALNLFKNIEYEYLLISLFIATSPISILAYTNSWLIKYYYYISFALIFLITLYNLLSNKKFISEFYINFRNSLNNINWIIFIFSFILTIFITHRFFPSIYRFEAHDVLYFGWLNDISRINYPGPIRIPTAFPYLLSANHLTAGSLLSPFLIFNNSINIFNSYTVKFFIIYSSLFNFSYQYLKSFFIQNQTKSFRSILIPISKFLLIFSIYFSEIDYSFAISNYPILLLILIFASFIFKRINNSNSSEDENKINHFILFIIYCSLITKATLFPNIILSLFFYILSSSFSFKKYYRTLDNRFVLLVLLMLFINILSWILPESNHGNLSLSFPFCININNFSLNSVCFQSFFQNPFSGSFIESFKLDIFKIFFNRPILEFAYIWLICMLPCLISGLILQKSSNNKLIINFGNFIICYSLATSITLIFIRESISNSGGHIVHSYIIAPILTIIAFLFIYYENVKRNDSFKYSNSFLIIIFSLILVIYFFDDSIVYRRTKDMKIASLSSGPRISLTYREAKAFDDQFCTTNQKIINKFGIILDKNNCGDNDLGEINSALKGKRTSISILSKNSIIKEWAIKPHIN